MQKQIMKSTRILQLITGLLEKNGGPIKSAITLHNFYLIDWESLLYSIGPNDLALVHQISDARFKTKKSFFDNEYGFTFNLLSYRKIIRMNNVFIHHGFYLATLLSLVLFAPKKSSLLILAHGSFQQFSSEDRKFLKTLFRAIFRFLSKRKISTIFVAMTDAEVIDIRRVFSQAKVVVTGLGFDLQVPKGIYQRSQSPLLLCLSRITEKKRIDLCIKAISILKTDYPDIKLQIAGTGDSRIVAELMKLVSDLSLENHVTFLGHIREGEAFEKMFGESSILLLPSEDENFALTVGEAIIRGVPVIVSERVGLSPIVQESNCGIVISHLHEMDLSKAVSAVLCDWNFYSDNCKKSINLFSHTAIKDKWDKLIETII